MKTKLVKTPSTYKLELDYDELQVIVSLLAPTTGSGINYKMYCQLSDLVDDEVDFEVVNANNKVIGTYNLRRK